AATDRIPGPGSQAALPRHRPAAGPPAAGHATGDACKISEDHGKMTTNPDARQDPLTYADAGVDIDAGNQLVEAIKPVIRTTRRPGADAEIGGFGGLFDLAATGYADPVLVAATDGVGTKLKIAIDTGILDTIG